MAFEIPLSNVARCAAGGTKSEAILEFHANENCPVQLTEMRLHMPPQGPDAVGNAKDAMEVICLFFLFRIYNMGGKYSWGVLRFSFSEIFG